MICSQCKRETVSKRANCFYCGGRLIIEEKVETALQCPGCKAFMKKIKRAEIVVDECQSCKGNWYDRSELEQLLRKSKSELTPKQEEMTQPPPQQQEQLNSSWPSTRNSQHRNQHTSRSTRQNPKKVSTPFNSAYRRCPHCQDMMNRNNFLKSGIIVDVCRKHGVYLDEGEFEDLHQFMLHNPMGF